MKFGRNSTTEKSPIFKIQCWGNAESREQVDGWLQTFKDAESRREATYERQPQNSIHVYEAAKTATTQNNLAEVASESAAYNWVPSPFEEAMKPASYIMLGSLPAQALLLAQGMGSHGEGVVVGLIMGLAVLGKGMATEIYQKFVNRSQAKKLVKAPQAS